jgi:G3E family GTPase
MTVNSGNPARYIMIGGFLGAGKSTAVLSLGGYLSEKGHRVGLITNDQSVGLVDTKWMRSHGFSVEEITGGCFCCRFDSLLDAADRLSHDIAPNVFVAEPVGSCTDLVATVSYPLRRLYGDRFEIAPLSVMVDPIRAERILGLESGPNFSEKVIYVYRKQLEEADLIVVNKVDLLDPPRLDRLKEALGAQFPCSDVLSVSVRDGTGCREWFDRLIEGTAGDRSAMQIDYDEYADGEARLGWLNAEYRLNADAPFDGEVVLMDLAERIQDYLLNQSAEIAHLKMTLIADQQPGSLAVLNVVGNELTPELSNSLPEQMKSGKVVINVRAEAPPEQLDAALDNAVLHASRRLGAASLEMEHKESFRPSRPTPTWRLEDPFNSQDEAMEQHHAAT